MELVLEDNYSEEERVNNHKQKKATSAQLTKLQEVNLILKFLILISKKRAPRCTKLRTGTLWVLGLMYAKSIVLLTLQELKSFLSQPLQPKTFSKRYLAGVSSLSLPLSLYIYVSHPICSRFIMMRLFKVLQWSTFCLVMQLVQHWMFIEFKKNQTPSFPNCPSVLFFLGCFFWEPGDVLQ